MKNIAMDGVKFGKVGKLENCNGDERMLIQGEERLCRSIIKGLARRNHERHTILADRKKKRNENKTLYASTTSPVRNFRGVQYAKLVSWN